MQLSVKIALKARLRRMYIRTASLSTSWACSWLPRAFLQSLDLLRKQLYVEGSSDFVIPVRKSVKITSRSSRGTAVSYQYMILVIELHVQFFGNDVMIWILDDMDSWRWTITCVLYMRSELGACARDEQVVYWPSGRRFKFFRHPPMPATGLVVSQKKTEKTS